MKLKEKEDLVQQIINNMGLDLFFSKKKVYPLKDFRKVNFLIPFFESLGYNVDNCIPIEILKEDVIELIDRCNKVLKNPELGPELLPTTEGFFFGNTEYDEDYLYNVDYVLFSMEEILPEFDNLERNESITFSIWY
jgi:hypothetical protein